MAKPVFDTIEEAREHVRGWASMVAENPTDERIENLRLAMRVRDTMVADAKKRAS